MSLSFLPDHMVNGLTDLTPELLEQWGVEFLMLDFDNTIVPYTCDVPTEPVEQWLRAMVESPIGICVVSNSKRDRVVKFCEARGIPCITHAKKPFSRGILQCRDRFALNLGRAAMIGDQIYTDVLGGNCAGAQSVLVTPLHLHNIWLKLRHVAEKPFIAMGRRKIDGNKTVI